MEATKKGKQAMNEDIMKAIEQAARMATQDQERMEKEAYINKVAMETAGSSRH